MRALERLFVGLAALGALAGAGIVLLIAASVAMRYFLGAPLRFTEELVGLLMTTAFLLALPLTTWRAEHVRVTILVSRLEGGAARAVAWLAASFGVAFCAWFLVISMPWLEFAVARGIRSEVARLLLWPWMAVMPVSLALTALAFALRAPRPGAAE